MAAKALVPVLIVTDFPPTVTSDTDNSQNDGVETGMLINSMSPVNSVELVPPRVNTPPETSVCDASVARVSQKLISGEESWLVLASVSQKGVAPVEAMVLNARPIIPELLPSRRLSVTSSTDRKT